jgi:hypothetical protein
MEDTSKVAYDLTSSDGKSTTVTWSMDGNLNAVGSAAVK